jgi:hypothetical protein
MTRLIVEERINGRKVWSNLRYCARIYLEELRKAANTLVSGRRSEPGTSRVRFYIVSTKFEGILDSRCFRSSSVHWLKPWTAGWQWTRKQAAWCVRRLILFPYAVCRLLGRASMPSYVLLHLRRLKVCKDFGHNITTQNPLSWTSCIPFSCLLIFHNSLRESGPVHSTNMYPLIVTGVEI